jgi:hypothetical protein
MIEGICKRCDPDGTANNRPVHQLEIGMADGSGAHVHMSTVAHSEVISVYSREWHVEHLRSNLDSSAKIADQLHHEKVKIQTRDTSGEIPFLPRWLVNNNLLTGGLDTHSWLAGNVLKVIT